MSFVIPIKHDQITVYKKLHVIHMNNQLLRSHLTSEIFDGMLKDYGPDEYSCMLLGFHGELDAPYTFFVRPNEQYGRPNIFVVMMAVERLDSSRVLGFDNSLAKIQICIRRQARKRWMLRFNLAAKHSKSKLKPLLDQNLDIQRLILDYYCVSLNI